MSAARSADSFEKKVDVVALRRECQERRRSWPLMGVSNTVVRVNTLDLEQLLEIVAKAQGVVEARYGIAPLPDGVSGTPADNELDVAIVALQVALP